MKCVKTELSVSTGLEILLCVNFKRKWNAQNPVKFHVRRLFAGYVTYKHFIRDSPTL